MTHHTSIALSNEAQKVYNAIKKISNVSLSKDVSEMIIAKYGPTSEYYKHLIELKKSELKTLETYNLKIISKTSYTPEERKWVLTNMTSRIFKTPELLSLCEKRFQEEMRTKKELTQETIRNNKMDYI